MDDRDDPLHNIMRALGRLEGKVDGLDAKVVTVAEDQREARDIARESRARIHERLDEQAAVLGAQGTTLGSIQSDIKIGAGIDAQVRIELDQLKKEVEPVTKHVKTLKWIAGGIAGAIVASGITVTVAAETVRNAVKSWLG